MILDIETTETHANVLNDLVRTVFTLLDRPAFWLLGVVYEIFFNVATAELFTNATIKNFYSRVQIILGVFMVFRLTITVLQIIVDPEKMNDKNEGFQAVIKRIIIGLLLLGALTPINIPGDASGMNSLSIEINNNGLLFGVLYDLQYRILSNNTIGRIVLGTTDGATNTTDQTTNDHDRIKRSARIFTASIVKAFMRINLKEDHTEEGAKLRENWMCHDIDQKILDKYTALDADPMILLEPEMINLSCAQGNTSNFFGALGDIGSRITGQDRYMFTYIFFIPLVMAIVFTIILLGFTVDIAIRAIKLAVLRLIAPIPVIAYMGPSSKDNASFNNWTKAVVSTYLDIFVRLAIIYFITFLIQDMIVNGVVMSTGSGGLIGVISIIFIWIGLFLFARQAPKFIVDVLGIKSLGSNIGLSAILGGAASLVNGGGLRGAVAAGFQAGRTANQGAAEGKPQPLGAAWNSGANFAAALRIGDPKAQGGLMNDIQDRLNRGANVAMARRYGVTAQGLENAKNKMQRTQAEADFAAANYQQAVQRGADTQTLNDLWDRKTAAETAAAKAKSKYEEGKKYADTHRVSPTFEEEHRPSLRERVRQAHIPGRAAPAEAASRRPDMYVQDKSGNLIDRQGNVLYDRRTDANGYDEYFIHGTNTSVSRRIPTGPGASDYRYEHDFNNEVVFNPGTQHQDLPSRITGTRENWTDDRTARTDNRWDPNSVKDASNEAETGFTQVAGVSVGQGQNNPVGGGPVGPPGGPTP